MIRTAGLRLGSRAGLLARAAPRGSRALGGTPVNVSEAAKDGGRKEEVSEKKDNWMVARHIAGMAKPHTALLAGAGVGMLTSTAINLSIPVVCGAMIDSMSGGGLSGANMAPGFITNLASDPALMGAALVSAFGVGAVANFTRGTLLVTASARMVTSLRAKLYEQLLAQPMSFYAKHPVGDLISRVMTDCYVVSNVIGNNFAQGSRSFLSMIGSFGMLAYTSPQLAGVVVLSVTPLALGASYYGRVVKKYAKTLQTRLADSTALAEERLRNIDTVKVFDQTPAEMSRWHALMGSIYRTGREQGIANSTFFTSVQFSGNLAILGLLGYGGHMVSAGDLTVGELSAFLMYTFTAFGSLHGLSTFYSEMKSAAGAGSRVFGLLDSMEPVIKAGPQGVSKSSKPGIRNSDATLADALSSLEGNPSSEFSLRHPIPGIRRSLWDAVKDTFSGAGSSEPRDSELIAKEAVRNFVVAEKELRKKESEAVVKGIVGSTSNSGIIGGSPPAIIIPTDTTPISVDGVDFAYPDRPEEKVLHGLDFEVNKGEFIGIVGPSGSGKSSILALLSGLHTPTTGTVSIGPERADIHSPGVLPWLHSRMGYVTQRPAMMRGTVADNIRFRNPTASDGEVVEAAKKAHCHDFISALPEGYNTYLGADTRGLSGGQRQRISIARALLPSPVADGEVDIMLFDEATSALDVESEARVQESLESLREEKTLMVVAHRLSTIRDASRIFVVDGGRIVEQGTPDELLANPSSEFANYSKPQA